MSKTYLNIFDPKRGDLNSDFLPSLKVSPHTSSMKSGLHKKTPSLQFKIRQTEDYIDDRAILSTQRNRRLPTLSIGAMSKMLGGESQIQNDPIKTTSQPISLTYRADSQIRKENAEKKLYIWDKVQDLRGSLGKYKTYFDEVLFPTKTDIKKIMTVLDSLSKQGDNTFGELMSLINELLRMAIFANPNVFETHSDTILKCESDELKTCSSENIPYYSICTAVLKELDSMHNQGAHKKNAYQLKIDELENIIAEKDAKIEELRNTISEMFPKEVILKKDEEIKMLNEKVEYRGAEIERLVQQINELVEDNDSLRKSLDQEIQENQRNQVKCRRLELEKLQMETETQQKQERIKIMQEKIKNFKDTFDKIIMKMSIVKNEIFDLRAKYDQLYLEKENFATRAAIGFEGLTPRPDYKKLYEANPFIELDIYDTHGTKQIVSTAKITEQLMNTIADTKGAKPIPINLTTVKIKSDNTKRRGSISITSSPKLKSGENSPRGSMTPKGSMKSGFARENISSRESDQGGRKSLFEKQANEAKASSFQQAIMKFHEKEHKEEEKKEHREENLDNSVVTRRKDSEISLPDSVSGTVPVKIKIDFSDAKIDNNFGEETLKKTEDLLNEIIVAKELIDKLE